MRRHEYPSWNRPTEAQSPAAQRRTAAERGAGECGGIQPSQRPAVACEKSHAGTQVNRHTWPSNDGRAWAMPGEVLTASVSVGFGGAVEPESVSGPCPWARGVQ